jgi:hypothetical protein
MSGCVEKKIKSVSNMTVTELKQYLQMRGVTVNGYLKPNLIEIAQAVEKMILPIDPNIEYILSDNLSSVRLREVGLPIGTSSKVSASVKEGCPLDRGYDNSILLRLQDTLFGVLRKTATARSIPVRF